MSPDQISAFIAHLENVLSVFATIDDLRDLRTRLEEAESRIRMLYQHNEEQQRKLSNPAPGS